MNVTRVDDPAALAAPNLPAGWPALTAGEIARHAPDASLLARRDGAVVARASLWWREAPPLDGHRVGAVGHYAASDADAARALLDAACAELARQGCTIAVGPMDGNTWRRYRLVTDRGSEPPFFLEPTNPDDWPSHFIESGFTVLAGYTSALATDLARGDERGAAAGARLAATGVTLRPLDLGQFDAELARIYAVARVSFANNFLYTPLPEAAFAEQYRAVRPLVRPELALIAEHEGRPVGFAFTVPDALEAARGAPARTVIVKTVAILPERPRYGGLGSWMVDATHRAAAALGYTRAVHALMHETNASRVISGRTGATMRRYALFVRPLA